MITMATKTLNTTPTIVPTLRPGFEVVVLMIGVIVADELVKEVVELTDVLVLSGIRRHWYGLIGVDSGSVQLQNRCPDWSHVQNVEELSHTLSTKHGSKKRASVRLRS